MEKQSRIDTKEFIEQNADTLTQKEVLALSPDRQFEYGVDSTVSIRGRTPTITYDEDASVIFRVDKIEDILQKPEILGAMIEFHRDRQVPRLDLLEQYYLGNNPHIMEGSRRNDAKKADHRARHAFARTISSFLNAYVLGNPVKIEPVEDSELEALEESTTNENSFMALVERFNQQNGIDSHNLEIGLDQNNFGRAYEMLHRNENDEDRIYRLDPKETFMIYDNTVRTRVIGAVRYYKTYDWLEDASDYVVELYTFADVHTYKGRDTAGKVRLELESVDSHSFNGIPIVEYRSDRYRMATFEQQIPLIDLYDSAQSDTANYMTDFNDAMLVIEGKVGDSFTERNLQGMLDANIILLEPTEDTLSTSQPTARYLTKQYDVKGVEAYKDRLKEDIYTQSNTPDLSDENFSGSTSGVAMQYKTFGLQQKQKDKEKYLEKGFRVRYKLLENVNRSTKEYAGDSQDLKFTFSPNLPKAYLEELSSFYQSGGELSNLTKLKLLSFVDNPSRELEQLQAEQAEQTAKGLQQSYDYIKKPSELGARNDNKRVRDEEQRQEALLEGLDADGASEIRN